MTTNWIKIEQPISGESANIAASSTASIEINASLHVVVDIATNPNYVTKLFGSWGPTPVFECASMEGESPLRKGEIRRIVYGEGTETNEEATILLHPLRHAYRLRWRSRMPFSGMAGCNSVDWVFTPSCGGTRVTWEADFTPNSSLVRPVVVAIAERFYAPFQKKCLGALKDISEQGTARKR